MSRHLTTRNILSKSMHAFLSNLANRQTKRQTDKRGQTHLSPPLPEVKDDALSHWEPVECITYCSCDVLISSDTSDQPGSGVKYCLQPRVTLAETPYKTALQ